MKHSQELINEAHELAFYREADETLTGPFKNMTNKEIAKKLKLTENQLHYILYVKQDSAMIEDLKAIDKHGYFIAKNHKPKKEPTIAVGFLDFFISEDFK
jgi:IMP cyclohydrolase